MIKKQLLITLLIMAGGAYLFGKSFDVKLAATRKPFLGKLTPALTPKAGIDEDKLRQRVLPASVELPVTWGDLGRQLVSTGVIDEKKFRDLYDQRGGLGDEEKLLIESGNGKLVINQNNSGTILNLLWALGLGNKNEVLEEGPMMDKQYGGAGNFASTGGWSLARGETMNHYSKHRFIELNSQQQEMAERVAKNIFRPCCDNSTYFPDCNHGMAMLALVELMAAQNVSEEDIYKYALLVNSYWFPDTYLNIAKYKQTQGVIWEKVNQKEVLGADYSSATGYRRILSEIEPVKNQGGGGCGV